MQALCEDIMVKTFVILITLLLFLAVLSPMVFYWWGLSNLDSQPVPSTRQITEGQRQTIWDKLKEVGSPNVKPISPYGYILYFQCEVSNGLNSQKCASKYPGIKISALSIRNQVRAKIGDYPSNLKWQFTWLAYTIWVTKNWNTEQIISTYYEASNT
jgi:hypothetical protein